VPDSVELKQLVALVEHFGLIESMRLVRPKSCAFINFCDTGAARALQAKFGGSEDAGLEIGGKRLTVNFARARPCKDEQLKQVAEGARRKLKVFLPEHISSEQLIGMLGHKAEQLVDSASVPMTEAEASRTRAEMAGEEDGESPPPTPTHAVRLDFSSLSTAIAVKVRLQRAEGARSGRRCRERGLGRGSQRGFANR